MQREWRFKQAQKKRLDNAGVTVNSRSRYAVVVQLSLEGNHSFARVQSQLAYTDHRQRGRQMRRRFFQSFTTTFLSTACVPLHRSQLMKRPVLLGLQGLAGASSNQAIRGQGTLTLVETLISATTLRTAWAPTIEEKMRACCLWFGSLNRSQAARQSSAPLVGLDSHFSSTALISEGDRK